MKIANIQSYNTNNYKYKQTNVNFKAWRNEVFISEMGGRTLENLKHTTATWMFRGNPDWKKFTSFLAYKYRDIPHVNVYDYACSNGSEAYTFLIAMMNDLGNDIAHKFIPVIAKDYDGSAIYRAQSGKINLDPEEISNIDRYTDGNFDKYFHSEYSYDKYHIKKWYIDPILTSNIQFSIADILKDYKNIKPNNSVVLVRNFWPYLSLENREFLVNGLYSQLGRNSIIVTGGFDREDPIHNRPIEKDLVAAGFKPSVVDYIFEK